METPLWPPIMCPKCFGMKWEIASHLARCVFCKHLIVKRRKWRTMLEIIKEPQDV